MTSFVNTIHNYLICLLSKGIKSFSSSSSRTKYLNFPLGTRYHDKNWIEKKFNNSDLNNIPAIAEIINNSNIILENYLFYTH